MSYSEIITQHLLKIQAVKLSPQKPFRWASGWLSPIYCDNRKTLSYPETRKIIYKAFAKVIKERYPEVAQIAGVATGAIAHGALVAEELGLPFIYVRAAAKSHGLGNMIEGELVEGKPIVMVEDLISTGGSSLNALRSLRAAGADVLGMVAIFTYGFGTARTNFEKNNCELITLTNYTDLIEEAVRSGYIKTEDLETLKKWRENPEQWCEES